MIKASFTRVVDSELEEPFTLDMVAEAVGAPRPLLARLVRLGILDAIEESPDEPLLPARAVVRLRCMQRLRRDLGVNFAGARVILDLLERLELLNREMADLRQRFGD